MLAQPLNAETLLRQVLVEIAQLPPTHLLIVYETISELKLTPPAEPPAAAEILARAKARAAAMPQLSHAEAVQRFIDATDRIRAEAIAQGVAMEEDWEGE